MECRQSTHWVSWQAKHDSITCIIVRYCCKRARLARFHPNFPEMNGPTSFQEWLYEILGAHGHAPSGDDNVGTQGHGFIKSLLYIFFSISCNTHIQSSCPRGRDGRDKHGPIGITNLSFGQTLNRRFLYFVSGGHNSYSGFPIHWNFPHTHRCQHRNLASPNVFTLLHNHLSRTNIRAHISNILSRFHLSKYLYNTIITLNSICHLRIFDLHDSISPIRYRSPSSNICNLPRTEHCIRISPRMRFKHNWISSRTISSNHSIPILDGRPKRWHRFHCDNVVTNNVSLCCIQTHRLNIQWTRHSV
mmetsp:Transcript_8166/g.16377  ORF Transcript_8166/g.16377 Transcript_8166/m.16377 type:complete len:303 (-) Transcript_8166:181-1089(-)